MALGWPAASILLALRGVRTRVGWGENPRNQPAVVVLKGWRLENQESIIILGFTETLMPTWEI